jgi:hypothetical protein
MFLGFYMALTEDEPIIAGIELVDELPSFLPSNITRAETALSKYPVHNLSKTDRIEIHIRRRGEAGDADIQWAVSASREYGEPRQLAYKVDTLVVNRRIDEAGRPIPRIIRLGSFRDICHQLDLSPSGDNFAGLRMALLQNASAFITAKITYRGADGGSKRFEAGFTRYSVVFTGDDMPNGYRADAIHILLNEHYWKLLNKAQFRPLDYDYQKSLKPAAHRFYELVSYSMYGALSKGQPEARLLYSDYCLRAPQERYFDRARVQKQMYKIHKPHMDSEYIAGVRYTKTLDSEGSPDWEICYIPGRRAKAHFAFFRKSGSELQPDSGLRALEAPLRRSHPKKTAARTHEPQSPLEAALLDRGVAPAAVAALLKGREDDPAALDAVEWGDQLIRQAPAGSFRNPAGFYVYLLRENITPPADFETTRKREARHSEQAQEEQRRRDRFHLEQAYEDYIERETAAHIQANESTLNFAGQVAEKAKSLRTRFRNMTPGQLQDLARRTVVSEIRRGLPLISFEEFQSRNTNSDATPDGAQRELF